VRSARAHCLLVLSTLLVFGQVVTGATGQGAAGRRVLIGFRSDRGPQTSEARAGVVRQGGGTIHRSLRLVPVVSATLSEEAIRKLRARADVDYVEDDVILHAAEQRKPYGVDRIDADLVWPTGNMGQGVKVAILDTGIDSDHPDLLLAGGVNFVGSIRDGSTNPSDWNDTYGHGTHVAGIVAARNNTFGVVGVAPDVSLWAVRVLGNNGDGYTSDIIQGLDWCAAHGVQVASMSFGGDGTRSLHAACDSAYAKGVVLVAAAGNERGAVSYPAAYPSVIAVSAVDAQDMLAPFSNFGSQIALAAPGTGIYSTYKDGSYAYLSGTSMACPHVVGAAALVWASGVTSAAAVRDRLLTTAEDLGPAGFDTSFGHGLVDAEKAAAKATPDGPPSVSVTAPQQGSTVSKTVVVQATANDDKGIAQVEFLVDGLRIGADSQGSDGWSASWDTTHSANGQHTLTATATDTTGQKASQSVTVMVQNASAVARTVSVDSITYSAAGDTQAGLDITLHVVNDLGSPVRNAYIWTRVYLNGQLYTVPAGVTNSDGSVTFKLARAPSGTYETRVARVVVAHLTWDGVTPANKFTK